MSTEIKKDHYYTEDHEWVRVEGNDAYIGISDYAQHQMGEVVYIELPEEGDEFGKGDDFAVIESVKAASDSFMPIGGKVLEANSDLEDSPENVNSAPYDSWLVKIEIADKAELDGLMNADKYQEFINSQEG